jgi:hypothetical protein
MIGNDRSEKVGVQQPTPYVKVGGFATCLKPKSDGLSSVLPLVVSEKWKVVIFLSPMYSVGQQNRLFFFFFKEKKKQALF